MKRPDSENLLAVVMLCCLLVSMVAIVIMIWD